ncbi:nucleotidyltransferase substrate binding protein [Fictibacillus iocasae]|uniref:Nucleotidyltransferase substrate binding protein n=1 Tax=Fictibacillus iocasae TaxID=2715437 RepID=A0ABW2NRE6_9BACL
MNKERLYEKLNDFKRASARLNDALGIQIDDDIVYDGVIQRFEFTFELSWKVMKMFLEYTGITDVKSPRSTIKEAFTYGLIEDEEHWLDMMIDRNKTSHLYDEDQAKLIYGKIKTHHSELLSSLCEKVEEEMKRLD